MDVVLQVNVPSFLEDTVASIVAFVPVLLSAIVVLIIGWIVGRILGGLATRIIERIGLSEYTHGTPLHEMGGRDDGLASAVGTLVSYIVYFYTILASANILGIDVLSQLFQQIGAFLPVVLSAVVILVLGFVVGRVVGGLVDDLVAGFGLDGYLRGTPISSVSQRLGGVSRIVGGIIEYYIYFLTLLTAAQVLQIPALSQLLNDFAGYLPTLIGGVVVLLVGVLLAEFIGDLIGSADRSRLTDLLGLGVKLFVYYLAVTIALDTIGFDTAVLTTLFTTFVTAFFGALAVALAIAVGIGVGWGSKDFVAENIDRWAGQARRGASDLTEESESTRDDGFESAGSND